MYAIAELKGSQIRLTADAVLKVPYMAKSEVGSEIKIDKILMVCVDDKVTFGKPTINEANATAEIIRHGRDAKVIVFKKKRRKGFRRTQGHRQYFTEIKIKNINI